MRCGEILWELMIFGQIQWDLVRYGKIINLGMWHMVRYGYIQLQMRFSENLWDLIRFCEICWDMARFWDMVIFSEIWWDSRGKGGAYFYNLYTYHMCHSLDTQSLVWGLPLYPGMISHRLQYGWELIHCSLPELMEWLLRLQQMIAWHTVPV